MVDGHEMVTEMVARSRAAQGLPPTIEDAYVLDQVIQILFPGEYPAGPVIDLAPLPERKPSRGPRRMPTTRQIAEHWDMPDRICWRCHTVGKVERAHIVDRVFDGLDGPQNLALLCAVCHKQMPIVLPDDWEQGLRYVGLDYR